MFSVKTNVLAGMSGGHNRKPRKYLCHHLASPTNCYLKPKKKKSVLLKAPKTRTQSSNAQDPVINQKPKMCLPHMRGPFCSLYKYTRNYKKPKP